MGACCGKSSTGTTPNSNSPTKSTVTVSSTSPVVVPTLASADAKQLICDAYGKGSSKPSQHLTDAPLLSPCGLIELKACNSRDYMLSGVRNKMHSLIGIQTLTPPVTKKTQRPAFELAIVLDISGSMDDCLPMARDTICEVIDAMEEQDTVHFITYHSVSETVFTDGKKNAAKGLKEKVQSVDTAGSTNISAGLEEAVRAFKNTKQKKGSQRVMFLFSDGQANAGITIESEMNTFVSGFSAQHNVLVTSFGLGSYYDADMLGCISQAGGGKYLHVKTPSDIETCVSAALEDFTSPVALNAHLKLRGKNGCVLNQILSRTDEEMLKGISFGTLRADNLQEIVAEISISPTEEKEGTEVATLEWTFTYEDLSGKKQEMQGTINTMITTNSELLEIENTDVLVPLRIAEVSKVNEQVAKAVGNRNDDEALKWQKLGIDLLQSVLPFDKSKKQKVKSILGGMQSQLQDMEDNQGNWDYEAIEKGAVFKSKVAQCDEEWMYRLAE
eukprot:TRINITY_DN75026_c0_g1_i1.p1 TRINITY_DN75026_c0_g1~~TRINITY_DN75026_c0_g1_i1.p1  ORF type:complete len:500 (-),score=52.30 TRINITY_DN75026_c0_g1_i1:186-1685(-)